MVDQSDISNLVKNSDLNTKFATLPTDAELKQRKIKFCNFKRLINVVLTVIFYWWR